MGTVYISSVFDDSQKNKALLDIAKYRKGIIKKNRPRLSISKATCNTLRYNSAFKNNVVFCSLIEDDDLSLEKEIYEQIRVLSLGNIEEKHSEELLNNIWANDISSSPQETSWIAISNIADVDWGCALYKQSSNKTLVDIYLLYNFTNDRSVTNFLSNEQHYINILVNVYHNLGKYFESDVSASLELIDKFEEPEPPKLRITISSNFDLLEAHNRMKNFKLDWFLENYDPSQIRIIFNLAIR